MLRSTFLLLPRVGPVTEARLWRAGCRSWDAYRAGPPGVVRGLDGRLLERHVALLGAAEAAIAEDPGFFGRELPAAEHWRCFGELGEDAAFLDIETESPAPKDDDLAGVTIVGVRRSGRLRQLVRGDDLTAKSVTAALEGASMLVTFAGTSFDLPVLRAAGARIPRIAHLDLHPALRRLGHRGGLKKIEVALGLAREDGVRGLTGYDAVLLWRRHLRGESGALERLLKYNAADVVNLEALASVAYAGLRAQAVDAANGPVQTRLRAE